MHVTSQKNRKILGADDLTLNVVDWGGDGEPLLFVHGYANTLRLASGRP